MAQGRRPLCQRKSSGCVKGTGNATGKFQAPCGSLSEGARAGDGRRDESLGAGPWIASGAAQEVFGFCWTRGEEAAAGAAPSDGEAGERGGPGRHSRATVLGCGVWRDQPSLELRASCRGDAPKIGRLRGPGLAGAFSRPRPV